MLVLLCVCYLSCGDWLFRAHFIIVDVNVCLVEYYNILFPWFVQIIWIGICWLWLIFEINNKKWRIQSQCGILIIYSIVIIYRMILLMSLISTRWICWIFQCIDVKSSHALIRNVYTVLLSEICLLRKHTLQYLTKLLGIQHTNIPSSIYDKMKWIMKHARLC